MWYTISKQTDNAFLTVTKKCSKTFTNAFCIVRALFCIFTTSSLLHSYLIWTNFSYSCAALLTGGCFLSNSSLFFTHTETHPYKVSVVVENVKCDPAFVLVLNNSTRTNAGLLIQEYDGSSLFSHCVFSAVKHLRITIGKLELSLPSALIFNHERF